MGKAKKARKKIKRKLREERARLHPPEHGMAPDQGEDKGKDKRKGEDKGDGADEQAEEKGPALDVSKMAGKRSGIKKPVIADLHREMTRQCVEGIQGWSGTPLNPQMPDGHKFVLLERQAGNVAESLASDSADSEHLYRECIRSAVVALAWAESLKKQSKGRPTQWATA
jgi:hypothetical protein